MSLMFNLLQRAETFLLTFREEPTSTGGDSGRPPAPGLRPPQAQPSPSAPGSPGGGGSRRCPPAVHSPLCPEWELRARPRGGGFRNRAATVSAIRQPHLSQARPRSPAPPRRETLKFLPGGPRAGAPQPLSVAGGHRRPWERQVSKF
ncbi:CDC42 small effector protein 1 isoform X1 [Sarcophilus harrisii]|uniref:CDC42 small effector protein 1 isoform X1 n=1 Tax=Sarcophilus harrisii TaxID=9305 RepID=UPI001301B7AE|nr:CDC42 small effector protein 1 isoform X1 [Sarcophilus harrisii]